MVPEARRVDAACERSQFVEGRLGGLLNCVQLAGKVGTVNEGPRGAEPDLDLYESLLRSIVKVLFETASLALGRLHDSQPRRTQFLHEARVFEREDRARASNGGGRP